MVALHVGCLLQWEGPAGCLDALMTFMVTCVPPSSILGGCLCTPMCPRFVCASFIPSPQHASSLPLLLPPPGASKAMELKGHKSQVMAVAFSPDNKRAITVSKDNTMRIWNIDVRYHLSEDPKAVLVVSGACACAHVYSSMHAWCSSCMNGSLVALWGTADSISSPKAQMILCTPPAGLSICMAESRACGGLLGFGSM